MKGFGKEEDHGSQKFFFKWENGHKSYFSENLEKPLTGLFYPFFLVNADTNRLSYSQHFLPKKQTWITRY